MFVPDSAKNVSSFYDFGLAVSDEEWIQIGSDSSVMFSRLKPGEYTLKIREAKGDGSVRDDSALMDLQIRGPWWKGNWAWLIYSSFLLVVLYIIRRYELSRLRLRNQMRISNLESKKLKEINQIKSKFFANISHEFRTPLTLIKGPLENLIEKNTDPNESKPLKMMHTNTVRLLELINQLLDLSKIESGNYIVQAGNRDITGFIEGLAMSFESLANKKNIEIGVEISPDLSQEEVRNNFYFDKDILEKICNNLISNALKFTDKDGQVKVGLGLIRDKNMEIVEISIKDTGVGIAQENLPYIFDRFYQGGVENKEGNEGSGIGLAFVSELVRVHHGEILVSSEVGKGTEFRVQFPTGKSHFSPGEIIALESQSLSDKKNEGLYRVDEIVNNFQDKEDDNNEKPWLLIVEDHDKVREYIIDSLNDEYRILKASNAREGFEMAQEFIPDLIVSDIMMPGINGFEFCEKIKLSEKTSHIPIILLTAMADVSDRITGFRTGADDYLTKPFNAYELRIRISNLIENRRLLRQKFNSNSIIKPREIAVTTQDAAFMKKMLGLVESNINNLQFSVEDLCSKAGMSQSQLHRKLRAIINMSANQFIRSVRLHRAMELLQKDAGNIAEVSYMVGYEDPGYFTKSFSKFFGKLPSEVTRQ